MQRLTGSHLNKFRSALRNFGVEFFYDMREARILRVTDSGPEPVDDRYMSWLRFKLSENFMHETKDGQLPYLLGKDNFYALTEAISHENRRDVFKDYLDNLTPKKVTKEDIEECNLKIDWMLDDIFGGCEGVYGRLVSRMITLGAVWRTYDPGCKFDNVPVLKGDQGIGKDTVFTSLLPSPRMYTTSFSFAMNQKERIECTRGCVLVVVSEMGGVTTTKDLENLKAYVTTAHDDMRMAYGRNREVMPRRFIFVCNTNLERPLPTDPSGNRRWCVVEVGPSKVGRIEDYLDNRRDELWAEAVAVYKQGIEPGLPRDLMAVQAGQNDRFERFDEQYEDAYLTALDNGSLSRKKQYTLTEIAVALGITDSNKEFRRERREVQHRLRDELHRQGWTSKQGRRNGSNVLRLWSHKDYSNDCN